MPDFRGLSDAPVAARRRLDAGRERGRGELHHRRHFDRLAGDRFSFASIPQKRGRHVANHCSRARCCRGVRARGANSGGSPKQSTRETAGRRRQTRGKACRTSRRSRTGLSRAAGIAARGCWTAPGFRRSASRPRPGRAAHLARPPDQSGPRCAVRLSERSGLPALGHRRGAAGAVPGAGLLLYRLGRFRIAAAGPGLPVGTIRTRPAAGQCIDRRGRRCDLRRVLLEQDDLLSNRHPAPGF